MNEMLCDPVRSVEYLDVMNPSILLPSNIDITSSNMCCELKNVMK